MSNLICILQFQNERKMMTMLEAWKDSLNILQQRNLKEVIKSIINTFKIMFKRWWFLYVLCIGLLYAFFNNFQAQFSELFHLTNDELVTLKETGKLIRADGQTITFDNGNFTIKKPWKSEESRERILFKMQSSLVFVWISLVIYFVLLFLTCLAARISREPKTYSYFKKYFKKFWPLLLVMGLLSIKFNGYTITIFNVYEVFLLYCALILSILFFFDSSGSFRNFINAIISGIKMVVYNLPLFLVIGGLRWLCIKFLSFSMFSSTAMLVYMSYFIGMIVQPVVTPIIGIGILAAIYNKKLQDQAELYSSK